MFGLALRLPVRSRVYGRFTLLNTHDVVSQFAVIRAQRAYATPGRPKSVVGEPSRPVKRAVKKAARSPADGSSAAEKQVAAKERSARAKTQAQKPLTEEQTATKKAKEEARKGKAKAKSEATKWRDLQARALKAPSTARQSPWLTFCGERMTAGGMGKGTSPQERREALKEMMKQASIDFKSLTAAEREHYNHVANEKNAAHEAEYKRWIESHSTTEIREANLARAALRRREKAQAKSGRRNTKWQPLRDERAVKRPATAFAQFLKNRHASGDFKDIPLLDRTKLIAQEWKALDGEEKKKYLVLETRERDRYISEYRSVYGHAPAEDGSSLLAAAAA